MGPFEHCGITCPQIVNFVIIGCLPMLFCSNIFIFPVYMNALKQSLQLNQRQVEFLGGIVSLSFYMGLPAAFFLRQFGPKRSLLLGMLVSVLGFTIAWAVGFMNRGNGLLFPVQIASYLMIGHGASYAYITALVTTYGYFGRESEGKVISFLEAVYGIGPLVNQQIYLAFFVHGDYDNYSNHNVFGCMIFGAAFAVAADGLAVICVFANERTRVPSEANAVRIVENNAGTESEDLLPILTDKPEANFVTILKNVNSHLLFWSTVLGLGITLLFELNISVFTETLLYNDQFSVIFICFHCCVLLSRICVGFVVDAFSEKISCMIYLTVISTLAGTFYVFSSVKDMCITSYYMFILINAALLGIVRPVSAVTAKRRIGDSLFASVWTLFNFCSTCSTLISQQILSSLYQMNIPDEIHTCYGQQCLKTIFALFSVCCFLIGILSLTLTIRGY